EPAGQGEPGLAERLPRAIEKKAVLLKAAVRPARCVIARLSRAEVALERRIVPRRAGVNVVPPKLALVIARGLAADVAVDDVEVHVAIVVEVTCRDAPRPAGASDWIASLLEARAAPQIEPIAVSHLRPHPLVVGEFRSSE